LVYQSAGAPHSREELGWDGTLNGRPLDPGVFVYTLQVRLVSGAVVQTSGEVVLLR